MSGKVRSKVFRAAAFAMPMVGALCWSSGTINAAEATAELGAGGLQIARNDIIELLSQDVFISANEVRVTYRLRNKSDKAASFLVSFPLPALDGGDAEDLAVALPRADSENFLDFQATADGKAVVPQIERRVTALGVVRAGDLEAKALPLNPLAEGLSEKIAALSRDDQIALNRQGLLVPDGSTMRPGWRLETTLYWQQAFAPGKELVIEHKYRPVAGTGLFGTEDLRQGFYKTRYCTDADFSRVAGGRLAAARSSDMPYLDETRVSFALNRSSGWTNAIRSFRLVVDKGDNDAVVSFCGSGIRRIAANQFEFTARNFTPDREINVLIVKPRKTAK